MINGFLTYEEACAIRDKEKKEKTGRAVMPQEGFQERVLRSSADIIICGGGRGGGKTAVIILEPIRYVSNGGFGGMVIRREVDDLKRSGGVWDTARKFYSDIGTPRESSTEWLFQTGSKIKFEHIADENKADQRFRGQQIPYFAIDEITQFKESTFWLLLSSNRNSYNIKNQVIGTCNPDSKSWVRKMIDWYIGEDGFPIPEREGVIRYFFKYGESVDDIIWGMSKEEVYIKAKTFIDKIYTPELETIISKYSLIKSFVFIRGSVSENKILLESDPDYVGSIAQGGEARVATELEGNWNSHEVKDELLTATDIKEKFFRNYPQQNGQRCITADIALQGEDKFVAVVWDNYHVIDIITLNCSSGKQVLDELTNIASKYRIPNNRIVYDANGLGAYIGGNQSNSFLRGSIGFLNNGKAKNSSRYFNAKSECADLFCTRLRDGGYSIDEGLLERYHGDKKLSEHILDERRILREYEKGSFLDNKFRLIPKKQMRQILGHSPDFMDALIMREALEQTKSKINGLGNFSF
mgnify:CR=1 FL=1